MKGSEIIISLYILHKISTFIIKFERKINAHTVFINKNKENIFYKN
jgi:hypothetical protein